MYCFTIIRQDSRLIPGILSPRRVGPPPAWTSSFPERSSFLPVTRVPSAAFCFSSPQRQRQSNKTGCQGRLSVAIVTFCVRMCYGFFVFFLHFAFCITLPVLFTFSIWLETMAARPRWWWSPDIKFYTSINRGCLSACFLKYNTITYNTQAMLWWVSRYTSYDAMLSAYIGFVGMCMIHGLRCNAYHHTGIKMWCISRYTRYGVMVHGLRCNTYHDTEITMQCNSW